MDIIVLLDEIFLVVVLDFGIMYLGIVWFFIREFEKYFFCINSLMWLFIVGLL